MTELCIIPLTLNEIEHGFDISCFTSSPSYKHDIPEIHGAMKSCHAVMQISPESHNTNIFPQKSMWLNFNIKIDFNTTSDAY